MAAPPEEEEYDDALPEATDVPEGGFRDRIRAKRGIGEAYRAGVFVAGLLCIVAGVALAVLPGPLTIPPIVLGLWIWSTEFEFAHKLFVAFKEKLDAAWEHAKRKPVSSAIVTGGGLVLAGVAVWAALEYDLVDKARDAVGL